MTELHNDDGIRIVETLVYRGQKYVSIENFEKSIRDAINFREKKFRSETEIAVDRAYEINRLTI